MPLHLGRSSGEHQDQTREARRFLNEHVRNDWSYPDAPHILPFDYPTSSSAPPSSATTPPQQQDAVSQVNAHIGAPTTPIADFTPTGWRERTYSDGEDSASSDNESTTAYETPDSVGSTLNDRKARRRRRRQQRLEEEMTWNIGLAHWSAQRNAWTGAQQRTPSEASSSRPTSSHTSSQPSTPTTPANTTTTTNPGAQPDTSLLLPLAPQILPNHPIRARMTPQTHAQIYTKIILQGRTPSIPINLQDITNSLIHGWKEEGNWPPKPAPPEASFTTRREKGHPNLRKGVQAVGRVLGFGGPGVPVEAGSGKGQV